MPFIHNSKNIDPNEGRGFLFPVGEYKAVIIDATEKKSSAGNDMLELTCQVIEHEHFHGKEFKHWVVFLPEGKKGAGMSVHFRKCIGLPHGGEDEVDSRDYPGKKFRAVMDVETEPYTAKNGKVYTDPRNKVYVLPFGADFPPVISHEAESVPF